MTRPNLGHTQTVILKLHPDLMNHINRIAAEDYCSKAEIVRRMILADMRKEAS